MKTGVLTQPMEEYYGCLDINSEKFEEILSKDHAKWAFNLKAAERAIEEMPSKIAVCLS